MNQNDLCLTSFTGFTVTISKGFEILKTPYNYSAYTRWRAYIKMDLILALGKADTNENDLPSILMIIKKYISHFCLSQDAKIILHRIDYRFDAVVEDERIRNILFKIFKKSYTKKYAMIQIKKIKSKPIPTTAYFYSKSKKVNVYDKQEERNAKGIIPMEYEENVIRFETQILGKHIYNKKRNKGLPRDLESYFTTDMFKSYMTKLIVKIFHKGDFYSFSGAKKIITESQVFKQKDLNSVFEFIKYISDSRSVTKAKEKFGKYTSDRYIRMLEQIGVNPLIIPKNDNIKMISNPFKDLYE